MSSGGLSWNIKKTEFLKTKIFCLHQAEQPAGRTSGTEKWNF